MEVTVIFSYHSHSLDITVIKSTHIFSSYWRDNLILTFWD